MFDNLKGIFSCKTLIICQFIFRYAWNLKVIVQLDLHSKSIIYIAWFSSVHVKTMVSDQWFVSIRNRCIPYELSYDLKVILQEAKRNNIRVQVHGEVFLNFSKKV